MFSLRNKLFFLLIKGALHLVISSEGFNLRSFFYARTDACLFFNKMVLKWTSLRIRSVILKTDDV